MHAWPRRDFDTVKQLVHDDVTFVGAMGATSGVTEYIDGLRGLSRMVNGLNVTKVFVDGDDVCVIYDLLTDTAGALPCVAWYRVTNGKVASTRVFFDPRPLLPDDA
jgi:hypothetical protein